MNIPLGDNFAVRASIYTDEKGGYIDNIPGTRSTRESARFRSGSTIRSNGTAVGFRGGFQAGVDLSNVNFIDANNAALVEEDFNDTTYQGARISALWNINDNWSLQVGAMAQEIDSDGTFLRRPQP